MKPLLHSPTARFRTMTPIVIVDGTTAAARPEETGS
jgi:hypothetical protein